MMTMQRKRSKLVSTLLTFAMVVSLVLSLGISAAAYDPNSVYLSPASGTQYTTITSAGSTVNLDVIFSAYDAGTDTWYSAGFDDATEATSVNWSIGSDPNGIIATGPSVSAQTVGGLIASRGTVILNSGVDGVAILDISFASFTLNLTIAVDAPTPQAGTVSTNVYVVDLSAGTPIIINNLNVNVSAPATYAMGNLLVTKSGAFQNLPTAAGTVDVMLDDGDISSADITPTGDYITEIDGITGTGWLYAVYNGSGNLINTSQLISPSIFELDNAGYTVVWKTNGSWTFQSTLAAEILTW